jgi:phosphoserine phosphatase
VQACQTAGLKTLLVSGRLHLLFRAHPPPAGLDFARANSLGTFNGRLTGTLFDRPWGDICDGAEKRRVVLEVCELMGIDTAQAIAVGDGANDLPMMGAAGPVDRLPRQAGGARAGDDLDRDRRLDRALEVLR